MVRRSLILLIVLIAAGYFAVAQVNDGRIEFSPYVGFLRFSDGTNLESSYIAGGRFSYAFTDHVAVEGQFGYLNADVRDPLLIPVEDNQFGWPNQTTKGYTFGGGVLYHLIPKEKVNPFFYGGMGIAHFTPNVTDSLNKFTAEIGGGVKVWLSKNIAFRADVRDAIVFSSTRHNLLLTAGLVFGFGDLESPEPPPPPPPPPAPKPEPKPIILEDVHFAFDKSTLTDEAKDILRKNIGVMKENPGIKVRIEGHTCAHGSEKYNQRLSERRAQAVMEFLVQEGGIPESRLSSMAYGETRLARPEVPTAANKDSEEAKFNRRVHFEIVVQ